MSARDFNDTQPSKPHGAVSGEAPEHFKALLQKRALSVPEASLYSCLSIRTIERLIAKGALAAERHGTGRRCGKRLIRRQHLDQYLDGAMEKRTPRPPHVSHRPIDGLVRRKA